jgi:hypothetical protein
VKVKLRGKTLAPVIPSSENGAERLPSILDILTASPGGSTVTNPHKSAEPAQPAAELLPEVYAELRRLAAALTAQLHPGQTLQPTVLVHEAYTRLVRNQDPGWDGRRHAGLSGEETAVVVGESERTVHRAWRRARAWLARRLSAGDAPPGAGEAG